MVDCYISLPYILSSAGDEEEIFLNLSEKKRFLKEKEFLGKTFLVGEVENILSKSDFFSPLKDFYTRTNALLLEVMLKLSPIVEKLKKRIPKERIGVCIGTTTSGIEENLKIFLRSKNFPLDYQKEINSLGHPAKFAKKFFGVCGPSFGISTACTSGLKAFFQAHRLIMNDLCDAVIVGGADGLSTLSLFGFESLEILSSTPCNPFSIHRNGINIGEGASIMLMTKEPLDTCIILENYVSNSDAFHLTKQDPEAKNAISAILRVLGNQSVDYISLHATGTLSNEISESAAISSTLPSVYASGIKGHIGHTLGATGAIEAGLCVLLLHHQNQVFVPIHLYDGDYDSRLPKVKLVEEKMRLSPKRILSVNFAFGGDNAVGVFGRKDANV